MDWCGKLDPDAAANLSLFQTIPEADWSAVDERVWNNAGAVVDLGCHPWDWSAAFIGRKRVVGADPFADPVPGAELFRGIIGPACGSAVISQCDGFSSVFTNDSAKGQVEKTVQMLSWPRFRQRFNLDQIAVLKINIEGSEWPLLASMGADDFDGIDQIAVSFHDFLWPTRTKATDAALAYLKSVGYTIAPINKEWRWYLCLR